MFRESAPIVFVFYMLGFISTIKKKKKKNPLHYMVKSMWTLRCMYWVMAFRYTPVTYRCTLPCNVHRQALAVEWVIQKSSVTLTVALPILCDLYHTSVREISALVDLPWSTAWGVIMKWKHLGAISAPRTSSVCQELNEMSFHGEKLHISLSSWCTIQCQGLAGLV